MAPSYGSLVKGRDLPRNFYLQLYDSTFYRVEG